MPSIAYFNSIKVRLERKDDKNQRASPLKFQFHKGAIRTLSVNMRLKNNTQFQFHKGAIRTYYESPEGFAGGFQFHKGAIRTYHPRASFSSLKNFNSIKVRLELGVIR